jgi:hypothetical protein
MPVEYENAETLYEDDFSSLEHWHHEGIGEIQPGPEGGMRLHCFGSRQGGQACMAFCRETFPDHISIEYEVIIRTHGGIFINYLACRGLNGEDLIEQHGKRLAERTGVMANYYSRQWGLQSYHLSISRFNDEGVHSGTSNWRRNPGSILVGHGPDPCKELNTRYAIRIIKDRGHCQLYCDGEFVYAFLDRDIQYLPIPDRGKFGFRCIGSDVMVDVFNLRVRRAEAARDDYTYNVGRF